MKVLFVCLGNICRSPLAEAILRDKIKKAGLENSIEVDSCGTAAYHIGELPDPRTIDVSVKNQVPISHRARQLAHYDFNDFDYIVAMDKSNLRSAKALRPLGGQAKLVLMRDFDDHPDDGQVPDPYWGGEDSFQEVFDILERSTGNFLAHIKNEA